ncbi:hypothetical protein Tco_1262724 [Tanacetum coccineum]
MAESTKRHEENSNIIKEIRASTDATIRNQRASIKTLEIQIGQMSKVLQEKRFESEMQESDKKQEKKVTLKINSEDVTRVERPINPHHGTILSIVNYKTSTVNPKSKAIVNFEIKVNSIARRLGKTFPREQNEDAHDHIDRVLSIVGLFNILGVSKDAVMLRVFPFTLTGSAKRRDESCVQLPGKRNNEPAIQCLLMTSTSSKEQQAGTSEAVGCQICEGPHLDKDCPLNEEVRQVEEVRYGEFGQTTPFDGNNGGKFHVGPPRYYTKTDNRPPYGERRQSLEELLAKHQEESARRSTKMEVWIKKLQENAEINTRNQNASLKNLETQIEQLTKELRSRKANLNK